MTSKCKSEVDNGIKTWNRNFKISYIIGFYVNFSILSKK